uniref:Uncharacterized protein n=1 Tax=Arundo donax TaxID=35708 RepID=A0A0A9BT24_ARUDO
MSLFPCSSLPFSSSFERVASDWLPNSSLAFSIMPEPLCKIVSMPDFTSP